MQIERIALVFVKASHSGETTSRFHLRPFFLPLDSFLGPCRSSISRRLSLNVPPANFPTEGPPTPRSRLLLTLLFDDKAGFSSIIPFSLASRRRVSSFLSALSWMPFRWDIGIFCCVNSESFAPRACILKSIALCRFDPDGERSKAESSKCDSFSSRCRARSFLRFAASVAKSLVSLFRSGFSFEEGDNPETDGGFVVCRTQKVRFNYQPDSPEGRYWSNTYHKLLACLFVRKNLCLMRRS